MSTLGGGGVGGDLGEAEEEIENQFVYMAPLEKFIYRLDGRWNLTEPVGKEGISHILKDLKFPQDEVRRVLASLDYPLVYGADLAPNRPSVYQTDAGKLWLNTWQAPTLVPKPGPYPRIQAVLDWMTCGDPEGGAWLLNWMAYKVQHPGVVPKTAVVLTTEPGAGKGTLAFLMRHMLGPENCAVIKREELENHFNARWIGKLFVLADEVLSHETQKDVSNVLKVLIDGDRVELDGKYQNQREVKNRLAWMFASNDKTAPLVLERGDRRYGVFSNHDPVTPEYARTLRSCFEKDNTPRADFIPEMQGFYAALLARKVDRELVARPYENAARLLLIQANKPTHELFCEYVDENGIDELLEYITVHGGDHHLNRTRAEWDFGVKGLSTQVLYRCYVEFTRRSGGRPLKVNKFGSAIANHRPAWPWMRLGDKRVPCYKVRRLMPLVSMRAG